ncbi:GPI alpha-1,2-mannosyltransferase 4-like [Babylonia areolata]|uniref:GPI alpha-1,2-mannosyltransferase 4-like n=1 Tax=Babylonia areolata TaxID=304850 RepID=UPI003FD68D7C
MDGRMMVAVLGFLLSISVLWPQPAYIHPDEFFQSTEVVAGDIFNITHLRTWEFQPDTPIRDITLPYLLFAPGFLALRWLLANTPLSHHLAESYVVLVVPRMVLILAGIVNVRLLGKLCRTFAVSQATAVWLWMTSYATWTYLTRSFSNTLETALFSALLLLLLETCPLSSLCCWRNSGIERVLSSKALKMDSTHQHTKTFRLCNFLVGVVLCVGFFNRPTFVFFVFVPLLWWFDQLCAAFKKATVVSVLFLAGTGFLLMFAVMSVTNSLYYNPEFGHALEDFCAALSSLWSDGSGSGAILKSAGVVVAGLRVPPWSFVQYNLKAGNLAEHGLHPWYTHLAVHLPSLLGPPAVLLYWDLVWLVVHASRRHCTDVLYAMVVLPVFLLSLFPHQEARFLLPILPVAVVCVARHRLASWRSVQALTLLINVLGVVMFGCLHQGGVVPALSALQVRLKQESGSQQLSSVRHHVISYATYMPPRHVLFTNPSSIEVHMHDMIGAHNHPPTLRQRVEELRDSCLEDSVECRFWLLLPAPALGDVVSMEGWGVKKEGEFCPHVSMERLPDRVTVHSWEDVRHLMSQLCLKMVTVVL